ncbi:zinc-dependent peptidase [Costertonia aggregata]|uniref:Zinc-dependent peptidase n=1 Tax=Costertonia aggregata TaxID=343403 RepID=A0A7H9ARK9_9FLAO|nr:zinc-dependent peptidase [Costertonia aggregata]QLG46121.1 zinc-dependent peptidase [Costertonia aggregata]
MFTVETFGKVFIIYVVCYLLYIIYYAVGLYQFNPFVKLKPLSDAEKAILSEHFPFYDRLPNIYKERCNSRIVWFRSKKKFVFYGNVNRREELKLVLSASAVMMTLGLKNFRMMRSLLRIIIYPSQYYSRIKKRHHLGEYNPKFKTVIFSADRIWDGFEVLDDNVNLAMHEFAHVLCFEMSGKRSWEARRFRVGLKKIRALFEEEAFRLKLVESNYFREYGMTNLHEFFSVASENYFETPSIFHKDFPELFYIIQRMLNFDFEVSCIINPFSADDEKQHL